MQCLQKESGKEAGGASAFGFGQAGSESMAGESTSETVSSGPAGGSGGGRF